MAITRRARPARRSLATGVGDGCRRSGAYGYLYERHAAARSRGPTVPVAGLPPALAGLRIGLLTDVHRSRWVSHEDVARAVAVLMREHPDLIVLGGDYVTWGDRQYVGPSAEALAALSAPHGVFAILGNHDDDHDMPAALAARTASRCSRTRGRGSRFATRRSTSSGIRFWTKRATDIAALVRGAQPATVSCSRTIRGG